MDQQLKTLFVVDGLKYFMHGESGYRTLNYLKTIFVGELLRAQQGAANRATRTKRVTVEGMYKETNLYWQKTDFKRKIQKNESPVALIYLVAILWTNVCHRWCGCFSKEIIHNKITSWAMSDYKLITRTKYLKNLWICKKLARNPNFDPLLSYFPIGDLLFWIK